MEEKRKFPRFPVTASVICFRYGRQMTMRTLNMSRGGLKLEANFDVGIGESMDLVILINGTRIRCRGTILGIEELNHKVQARLRFTHTSKSEQRELSDYLHSLSVTPSQKALIGGLFILAVAFLIVMIGYTRYFHPGPNKEGFEENRQLKGNISARPALESKMEAETELRKEDISLERNAVVSIRSSRAGYSQKNDIRKPHKDLADSQPSGVTSESGAEFQTVQGKAQGLKAYRMEESKSKGVSPAPADSFPLPQRKQTRAVAAGESVPARSNPTVIQRSAIALGVENREPTGVCQRVSVRQERVYCWMHVINGRGGDITVRWIGKGQRIAEVYLPVGSDSWRTWAYASLTPSMIGPAQVDILNENGELLKSLSFEITE